MKILIVDDDLEVLEYLKTFFEQLHHDVVLATGPDECIKKMVLHNPDLILLDIVLPRRDGLTVLREIKEIDRSMPVVMITAYKDAERIIDAFRLGAFDCLLKPFNFDYLTNFVLAKISPRSAQNSEKQA